MLAAGMLGAAPQAGKRSDSPDAKEIRDYRLSMESLQKFVAAFKVMSKDDAVAKCSKDGPSGNAETLDASQKRLEGCPAAIADLNAQGLKPREFPILTAHAMGDFMAVTLKKAGQLKQYPPSISPENADFLEFNYDKLKVVLAPMTSGGS